jgi:cytosine/adenosine deaminase-related metal-dependent hydrolase
MPQQILVQGGEIITMTSPGAVRADLLIEGSKIAQIGPDLDTSPDVTVIDAAGSAVMPGFIDTHRHMWQGALRGTTSNDIFAEYFGRVIYGYAGRVTPDDVYDGVLAASLEALDAGTTSILDWAHAVSSPGHADASISALQEAGIRGVFAYGPPGDDVAGWWSGSERRHPDDARRVRETLRDDSARVTMALALRGPEFTSLDVAADDIQLARELGLRSTMHIGLPGLYQAHGGVSAMDSRGLLGTDITLVHGNSFTPDDLKRVAASGSTLSVSPEVEMQMGFGWPLLRAALDAGVRPSLSVDVVTAIGGDVRQQARQLLQVGRALDHVQHLQRGEPVGPLRLTAWDALEFSTVQVARALGFESRVGTLEVGKQADIIVVDGSGWNLTPFNDAVSQVALAAHPGNVTAVIVAGDVVKRDGKIVSVTEAAQAALRERLREAAQRLTAVA